MLRNYSDAAELLKEGAVGLLPSDTIYGLSCAALNEDAVGRIYKLKDRDYNKPLIILLADVGQAELLGIDKNDLEPLSGLWPAPLTAIVRGGPNTPKFLHRGACSLAVRIPDNERLLKLLKQTGPLVSTSANPQGHEPAYTAEQAKKYFGGKLDFYIDAGEIKAPPSTLVRLEKGKLNVLRQGMYKL